MKIPTACELTGARKTHHIFPFLASLHWIPGKLKYSFETFSFHTKPSMVLRLHILQCFQYLIIQADHYTPKIETYLQFLGYPKLFWVVEPSTVRPLSSPELAPGTGRGGKHSISSLCLRVGLKPSLLIKLIVSAGTGLHKAMLLWAQTAKGIPMMHRAPLSLSFS